MVVFTRDVQYEIMEVCYLHREEVGMMNLKKILTLAGVALALFLLITQPEWSAQKVLQILDLLWTVANAFITFIRSLFG